jgi:hypothetical protein
VVGARYQYVGASLDFAAFKYSQNYSNSSFFLSAGVRF